MGVSDASIVKRSDVLSAGAIDSQANYCCWLGIIERLIWAVLSFVFRLFTNFEPPTRGALCLNSTGNDVDAARDIREAYRQKRLGRTFDVFGVPRPGLKPLIIYCGVTKMFD